MKLLPVLIEQLWKFPINIQSHIFINLLKENISYNGIS